MLRWFVLVVIALIAVTVIRSVIGVIAKALSPGAEPARRPGGRSETPTTGELKRDPVCGTYVSTAISVKKSAGNEVLHFCSETCRDKYKTA